VVHAGLVIFGRKYSVPFTIFDFLARFKFVEVPSHKTIEIGISISRDERTAPINLKIVI